MTASRFTGDVISKTTVQRETKRRIRRSTMTIGEDLHRLRLDAGVSLRELEGVVGTDASHIARIEKGTAHPSLQTLTSLSVALGADMSVRFYSGSGPRIHDRFQAPMLEELLRRRHSRWRPELEVLVTTPSRGIVDVVLDDSLSATTAVGEVQSEFRRLEEQIRRIGEKVEGMRSALVAQGRADRTVSKLLIVRSTEATREIARRYHATLAAAYPARTADVVDAITGTAPWPGDGIAWMRLVRGVAELLPFPPRGVPVGR